MLELQSSGFYDAKLNIMSSPENLFVDIHWVLTENCVYNCNYCYRKYKPKTGYVNIDIISKVCNEIYDAGYIRNLTLIGGEPTLHPHFKYITDRLVNYENIRNLTIFSNAHSFDILCSLKPHNRLSFILTYHAAFANIKDFIEGIEKLVNIGHQVKIIVMLEIGYYDKILDCINKLKALVDNNRFSYSIVKVGAVRYDKKYEALVPLANYSQKNYIYYLFNDGTLEIYDDNEMKTLNDKVYHSFMFMTCYKNSFISMSEDGKCTCRCDNSPISKSLSNSSLRDIIHTPAMCTKTECFNRDDVRFIYKYRSIKLSKTWQRNSA